MGFYRDRDDIDEANNFGKQIDTNDPIIKLFGWVYGQPDMEQRILKDGRHEPIIKMEEHK